ncbi:GATA zinc finger domain-containing protein 14-like [Schistocerca piceifrons]|uniref:GATA zinc finger domain-containing protein 14-like n=1 Tax=Schistocerca piceifrons TaxID=274613 RepID=UPI001F5EDF34|nr:GATA zinc finger domain-containing protein 14-like [Schistocerca piceifrons]
MTHLPFPYQDRLIGVPENDIKTFLNFLDQMDVVYSGDSCHANFTHISNQNQHLPQRNRSDGGWWNHLSAPRHNTMPARKTYSNGNVYDGRINRRNSWNNNNNNNYHPYQDGNYTQNEIHRQYNNNRNRRHENNRYNPGYFDRNMPYNRHNYHQNNNNPNNRRQNMWNTQNSRMTNHNPPRNPPPFPSTVMHSPPRSNNNNCGAPSADAWAPTCRIVNIMELANEPIQTQQTTENSRRPS